MQLEDEKKLLKDRIQEMIREQDETRKNFFAELQGYKSQYVSKLAIDNKRMGVNPEDIISVSLYDTLQGIDAETLKMINFKITEVKEIA